MDREFVNAWPPAAACTRCRSFEAGQGAAALWADAAVRRRTWSRTTAQANQKLMKTAKDVGDHPAPRRWSPSRSADAGPASKRRHVRRRSLSGCIASSRPSRTRRRSCLFEKAVTSMCENPQTQERFATQTLPTLREHQNEPAGSCRMNCKRARHDPDSPREARLTRRAFSLRGCDGAWSSARLRGNSPYMRLRIGQGCGSLLTAPYAHRLPRAAKAPRVPSP